TTDRAKLYSPPIGKVPIWLAAGGPRSAALAARRAEGVITSVKDPASTLKRVVQPARAVAEAEGRPTPTLVTTRWAVFADNDDEAWEALSAWRGLRAPGRLEAVDPEVLRTRADDLPRDEILSRYTIAASAEDIVDAYLPLVTDLAADVVTIQMTSTDQPALISLLGSEVLPVLQRSGRPTP
ncbi:MAG TPA: LLM class flavin-dependent oxidoreductase, partial [Actinobacteria bacterium]|nr:LLM class flavin-dependent oxidoreductase [Actinomycetota bacterium]